MIQAFTFISLEVEAGKRLEICQPVEPDALVLDNGEIFIIGGATPTAKPGCNLLLPDIAIVL